MMLSLIYYAYICTYVTHTYVVAAPFQGVQNVSATATSATEVRVTWRPPELEFWNGVLTNYTVGE